MNIIFEYSLVTILGLVIGSFLNVLIDRLPEGQSIGGRSFCDHCKKKLSWQDLFPVFSFISFKGKSRCCSKKLSLFYPLVEIFTGISFLLSWFFIKPQMLIKSPPEILSYLIGFNSTGQIIDLSVYSLFAFKVLFLILVAFFIVMFFADIKYYIIPDSMQFGAFLISLIIFIILNLDLSLWVYKLVSSILIACPLFLIFYFTKGRGMGFGDVKLGLLMGLILGAYSGFLALYCSFISGAVISLATLVLKKKSMKSHIPFGPFLIFGTFVIIFAENFVYDKIVMLFVF